MFFFRRSLSLRLPTTSSPFLRSPRSFASGPTTEPPATKPELLHCWKCGKHLCTPSPTCKPSPPPFPALKSSWNPTHQDAKHGQGCGAIQPVLSSTFFDVFQLDPSPSPINNIKGGQAFVVDLKAIKKRFLELQALVHPDANSQRSEKERTFSERQSQFINKAYQAIRDPLARAKYILHLNKIHVDESSEKSQTGMTPLDLMKIMDIWEEIELCTTQSELDALVLENEDRIRKEIEVLERVFREGTLEKAKEGVVRLQYWYSLRQRMRDVEL
ncbi:hypothetical protein HDU98_003099 [Podochytrium sp. JEL0797]|nr:hypothetical protein HDU98_003099 [Podochytrium sp. JEL0797]